MLGYRVPSPDEAMLISGSRYGLKEAPFRVVTGHGAIVTPMFRKVRYLTLAMQEAEVSETCVTKQGISLRDQAGHLAERPRGDRVQGRQRPRVDRQRRPAVPVRPGPDVGADRADLRLPLDAGKRHFLSLTNGGFCARQD